MQRSKPYASRLTGIRWPWLLVTVFAFAMASYAAAYFVLGERIFPDQVAESFKTRPWGIYSHAFFGAFGITIGPFQFTNIARRRRLHRTLGKVYLVAAAGTGLSGLYMAVYAYGGIATNLGFAGMALAILVTTLIAYRNIRLRQIRKHRAWMLRSYAVMFSAVTFRLWLGILSAATGGNFTVAYLMASWLSWVLNLLWAEIYLRQSLRRPSIEKLLSDLTS